MPSHITQPYFNDPCDRHEHWAIARKHAGIFDSRHRVVRWAQSIPIFAS